MAREAAGAALPVVFPGLTSTLDPFRQPLPTRQVGERLRHDTSRPIPFADHTACFRLVIRTLTAMGFLRLLLAIAVVIDHSAPFCGMALTGGRVSVQLFYMMSGFYMALILDTKYHRRGDYRRFFISRALRLFPVYWAVLALTICASLGAGIVIGQWGTLGPWISHGPNLAPTTQAILATINVTLLGQDATMFTGLSEGSGELLFETDFTRSTPAVHSFLLVPQAWSLGIELLFYLVAPFLMRQTTRVLMAVLAASLLLRIWLALAFGLTQDPWTYRFFPCELALFMFGALAFRWRGTICPGSRFSPVHGFAAITLMAVLIMSYPTLAAAAGPYAEALCWLLYGTFIPVLPAAFRVSQLSTIDRQIGELSYPLYISHILVIWIVKGFVVGHEASAWLGECAVLTSVATAYALKRAIADPVERLRLSFAK